MPGLASLWMLMCRHMEGDPHLVTKDGQDNIHPFTRLNALQHLVQSVMQAAVYLQDSESESVSSNLSSRPHSTAMVPAGTVPASFAHVAHPPTRLSLYGCSKPTSGN